MWARFDALSRGALTYLVPFPVPFLVSCWIVRLRLIFCLFLIPGVSIWAFEAQAQPLTPLPRVGAARVLRLVDASGRPVLGSFSRAHFETRGGGLFFTREWGGTRNIWRAAPDWRDTARYPAWRATPVTQFEAPLFADNVVPLEGDRALLLVSNASDPRQGAQIVRYEVAGQQFRSLTIQENGAFDPAPSPDGEALSFAATRSGVTSVYTQNFGDKTARRVAINARRPLWLGRETLLVESVAGKGVFRLPLREISRPTLFSRGHQVTATRGGNVLVLSMAAPDAARSVRLVDSLYLLAGDGSGLRSIAGTRNAQNPVLSPQGDFLAFDAPISSENSDRLLWIVPLEASSAEIAPTSLPTAPRRREVVNPQFETRSEGTGVSIAVSPVDAPFANLTAVRRQQSFFGIYGVARGGGGTATVEIGEGQKPRRWEAIPAALSGEKPALLARWIPPAGAGSLWTIRLTVSGTGGAAQSLLTLNLLPQSSPKPPDLAPERRILSPFFPQGGPLPQAPLPDLPAPPSRVTAPINAPVLPSPAPQPSAPPPILPPSATIELPGRDAANFNVSGTLATMQAGQTVSVTFWALNNGTRAWEAGKSGQLDGAVRLVARFVDAKTGLRRKWALQWMKTPVVPGNRTRWSFDLVAPTKPGRYKLIYGLVRLPDANWQAPAFNAPQESWPHEFAAIAFAVTVAP